MDPSGTDNPPRFRVLPTKINAHMKTLARALMISVCLSGPLQLEMLYGQQKPRIGLALSGGGARGLAHIGVLDWIERNRIPVDYVAGTSMGGVIGGFYASGMTPVEIRRFITALDWDKLLTGPPSYDELSMRRKEDRRAYPASLEFGLRGGLRLPRAVNPGQYIGLTIDRVTLPYGSIQSFDELPIPFMCVAADLLTAETVVLKDGSLAQALRATMAMPGIFAPVEIGKRVLVDGGLVNNIPSDLLRQLGADVVIAVNAGSPLLGGEHLQTLPGILEQVIGVATVDAERQGLALATIVITPDLGEYRQFDFGAREKIIELGYKSAESMTEKLKPFSLDESAWNQHLAGRRAKRRVAVPTPAEIEVLGVDAASAPRIVAQLEDQVGRPIDPSRMDRALNDIRGGGLEESLGYEVVESNNTAKLRIRAREKPYGPPFITPAIQIQSRAAADVAFSAGFRLTHFHLGGQDTELRFDAVVGSNTLFGLEYFWPFGRAGAFIAPRALFTSDRSSLYRGEDRTAQYLVNHARTALDAGYIFGKSAELRVGYEIGSLDANVDIGGNGLQDVSGLLHAASARFIYNSLNSAMTATSGSRFAASYSWYLKSPGAPAGFPLAEMNWSGYLPVSRRGSLLGSAAGGTTFQKTVGPAQQFTLGGPLRLSAYGLDQFRGNHYVLATAGYRQRLGVLPSLIGGNIYASVWLERGSAFFRRRDADYRNDAAAALTLDTLLGPLVIGGAWGDSGKGKVFFSFGRNF
jgi:NTE family protein